MISRASADLQSAVFLQQVAEQGCPICLSVFLFDELSEGRADILESN